MNLEHAATTRPFDPDVPVFLKPSAKVEPLYCSWLAWPHLLSPVQAAMNVLYRYLPLLHSFVANPSVHIAATRDPKMFGGPFVHLRASDIAQVKRLIADTQQRCGRLLQLAKDAKSFNAALQSTAAGYSLDELYQKLPPSLAGIAELMYDLNNHPRLHLIEPLVYSDYASEHHLAAQSLTLSLIEESDRNFFLSTPRLAEPSALVVEKPYSDPAIDALCAMRTTPAPLATLASQLGRPGLAESYSHLFTGDAPQPRGPTYAGPDVRLRYFGHACVLVQTEDTSILFDPMFSYSTGSPESGRACNRYELADLPGSIDYVVLTHCHQDHFNPEMLIQIRRKVRHVIIPRNNRGSLADPSMKLGLSELGFDDMIELDHFEEVPFESGKIVSIPFPGEHADLEIYSKHSALVSINGRNLIFLVDSDGRDVALYQRISRHLGIDTVDAVFLGMECHGAPLTWLYGPLLGQSVSRRDDESRRLSGSDFERARRIVSQFNCRRVYVYAMGQEPWLRHIMGLEYSPGSVQLVESDKLVEFCNSRGIASKRLYGSEDFII